MICTFSNKNPIKNRSYPPPPPHFPMEYCTLPFSIISPFSQPLLKLISIIIQNYVFMKKIRLWFRIQYEVNSHIKSKIMIIFVHFIVLVVKNIFYEGNGVSTRIESSTTTSGSSQQLLHRSSQPPGGSSFGQMGDSSSLEHNMVPSGIL